MSRFIFSLTCIEADGDAINEMKSEARAVSYRTFVKFCEGVKDWALAHHYGWRSKYDLSLRKDWHVGYFRSRYRGQPCYYLAWSGIEQIWLPKEA